MNKRWSFALAAPIAVAAGLLLVGSRSDAADHLDAPGSSADPAADINDLYVFRSKDPAYGSTKRTVFVLTVNPLATAATRFSDKVDYEIRIEDAAPSATAKFTIKCTANTASPQVVSCAMGSTTKTIEFNAVDPDTTGPMRVFAGLRDDPFFIDLDDVKAVLADPTKVSLLVKGNGGTDFLAGANVLTLVVDVDNALFGSSSVLRVHAVTTRTGN